MSTHTKTPPKHSPLPWVIMADPVAEWTGAIGIASSDGFALAEAYGRHRTEAQSKANASHILRCVNAHYGLVAALKASEALFLAIGYKADDKTLSLVVSALAAANREAE